MSHRLRSPQPFLAVCLLVRFSRRIIRSPQTPPLPKASVFLCCLCPLLPGKPCDDESAFSASACGWDDRGFFSALAPERPLFTDVPGASGTGSSHTPALRDAERRELTGSCSESSLWLAAAVESAWVPWSYHRAPWGVPSRGYGTSEGADHSSHALARIVWARHWHLAPRRLASRTEGHSFTPMPCLIGRVNLPPRQGAVLSRPPYLNG